MVRMILRIMILSLSVLFLADCDTYEFPEVPYPRTETLEVVNISSTGVKLRGKMVQLGDEAVVDHGFVWGFVDNATQEFDNEGVARLGAATTLGEFEVEITSGLQNGKTYYVRAFANSATYKVYGNAVSFIK